MQERPHSPLSLISPAHGPREGTDLVSAISAYERASTRVVRTWFDIDDYAECSKLIDVVRDEGVLQPVLAVLALQLYIAHSELISTLWQNAAVGVAAVKMDEVQARHTAAIVALRAAAAEKRTAG